MQEYEKKAIITGGNGFVGRYMSEELISNGYEVTIIDRMPGENTIQVDILDAQAVKRAVELVRPGVIFHLAGQANVALSWKNPAETFEINVLGALNLMEAVREYDKNTHMVIIGSSDQYGQLGHDGESVNETHELNPNTPYAISKMAQEKLAQSYVNAYGMNICLTRSFNHGGAGQRPGFIIADFAKGIAEIEKGRKEKLSVGNLTSRRDFTHVKDIARAYRLIAEKGKSGEIYNVGSGVTYAASEILNMLIGMAKCPVMVSQDPGRMRPSDTPVIRCDSTKLTSDTGWKPRFGIGEILWDTLEFYRSLT